MAGWLTVELLDGARERLHAVAAGYARRLPGLRYCDIRVEVREEKGAAAENGHEKASSADATLAFGVRAIAGDGATAAGYYGRILGDEDAPKLEAVVRQGLRHAYQRAFASARQTAGARARYGAMAGSLTDTVLAPAPIVRDTVPASFTI
ncbi:MAG: TldD/PmbA family protein, partial [Chloroflexota bacterium]|nr:TldD/PmbA family protein [Chloroflexota bacterium]